MPRLVDAGNAAKHEVRAPRARHAGHGRNAARPPPAFGELAYAKGPDRLARSACAVIGYHRRSVAKAKESASGPYRAGGGEGALAAGEDGLVGDLVRQFADPYAFHRELIQNAIDAGATSILVRVVIQKNGDRSEARVSVQDDGTGMSQKILEEDLVVLFRSSKEHAEGKIGKFGIGFVSVLALAPSLVEVASAVGDGARHVLHLHPDRTYDLYREEAITKKGGTTVTLHVPLEDDGEEMVTRSRAALSRWCGHARVPIRLLVLRAGDSEPSLDVRIDTPLAVEGLVQVAVKSADGHTEAAIGLVLGGRLAAFYNRGLLLHESREKGARASIAFKVADGRLSHTLSREDVRRDAAFDRALRLVERGIEEALTPLVQKQIALAAEAHANGDAGAGSRWLALVQAVHAADLDIGSAGIAVPLLAPVSGSRVGKIGKTTAFQGDEPGPFAETLAAAGIGVIDRRVAKTEEEVRTLSALLGKLGVLGMASAAYTVVRPLSDDALGPSDRRLLSHVGELLARVLRKPSGLFFANVEGRSRSLSLAVTHADRAQLVTSEALAADPFRFLARPPLALDVDHAIAQRARTHGDVLLAADVLVRAILLERHLMTEERSLSLAQAGVLALASRSER